MPSFSRFCSYSVLVLAFLASCADTSDETHAIGASSIRQAIINGQSCSEKQHPSAVALIYDVELRSKTSERTRHMTRVFCGGTLIAPDVVLTAAHCLHSIEVPNQEEEVLSAKIYVSPNPDLLGLRNYSVEDLHDQLVVVKSERTHDSYVPESFRGAGLGNHNDLALLYLEQPLDLPWSKVAHPDDMRMIVRGTPVYVVGWGAKRDLHLAGGYTGTVGVKRCGESFVNELGSSEMQIGSDEESVRKCYGDSGSATFAKIKTEKGIQKRLIGITSHSYAVRGCHLGGVDTRVDVYYDWIDRELRQACRAGIRSWCEIAGLANEEQSTFASIAGSFWKMVYELAWSGT
jgi:secreted trypsin-like serine protease